MSAKVSCPGCGKPIPMVPRPILIRCAEDRDGPGCNRTWRAQTYEQLLAVLRGLPHYPDFARAVARL